MKTEKSNHRQTVGEELANSISHGVGLLIAMVAVPFLIVQSVRTGGTADTVGAIVFGASLLMLFLASTIYHALPEGRAKAGFQLLDHCAIYLLIAGTYTPFTLGVLRGSWGWSLFGVIWGLATLGILTKTLFASRGGVLSTCLYLAMGWLILIAVRPLLQALPPAGIAWLVAGGVAYTAGVAFYVLDHRIRYGHFVWHLFVVAGAFSHFVVIYKCTGLLPKSGWPC